MPPPKALPSWRHLIDVHGVNCFGESHWLKCVGVRMIGPASNPWTLALVAISAFALLIGVAAALP